MNIKQAKDEIRHTVQAYLSKDAFGEYKNPGGQTASGSVDWTTGNRKDTDHGADCQRG